MRKYNREGDLKRRKTHRRRDFECSQRTNLEPNTSDGTSYRSMHRSGLLSKGGGDSIESVGLESECSRLV